MPGRLAVSRAATELIVPCTQLFCFRSTLDASSANLLAVRGISHDATEADVRRFFGLGADVEVYVGAVPTSS